MLQKLSVVLLCLICGRVGFATSDKNCWEAAFNLGGDIDPYETFDLAKRALSRNFRIEASDRIVPIALLASKIDSINQLLDPEFTKRFIDGGPDKMGNAFLVAYTLQFVGTIEAERTLTSLLDHQDVGVSQQAGLYLSHALFRHGLRESRTFNLLKENLEKQRFAMTVADSSEAKIESEKRLIVLLMCVGALGNQVDEALISEMGTVFYSNQMMTPNVRLWAGKIIQGFTSGFVSLRWGIDRRTGDVVPVE